MRNLARSTVVHVAFAFLAMGGWTLWANHHHGLAAALVPAMVQGGISALITMVLKRAIEVMAGRLRGLLAYVLPPLVTASVILGVLITVHHLIGTPEIAPTIAVPWSVSTLYAIVYGAAVARGRARVTAR